MTSTLSNGTPCGLESDSRSDSSSPSLSPDESDTELDNVTNHSRPASSSCNSITGPEHKPTNSSGDSVTDVAGWWLPADGHAVALVLNFELIAKIVASLPLIGFFFCFVYSMLYQFDQVIDKDCPVFLFAPTISSLTSQAPGRYLWRILVALHSAPRLLALIVYWAYYKSVLTTYIEPRFRHRASKSAKAAKVQASSDDSGITTPIASSRVPQHSHSTGIRQRHTVSSPASAPKPEAHKHERHEQLVDEAGSSAAHAVADAGDSRCGDARLPNPVTFRRWMYATLSMAVAENIFMLLVTYISNKENYPVHEKAFLLYGICSGFYMPFSVRLYRLCCDALPHGWTPERRATYRFKSRICYTCMSTLFIMGICFYGYIGFCLPIVFNIFCVLEYLMLILNTVFHYGFLRDFPGLKMILGRPVPVLNVSAVPLQNAGVVGGCVNTSTSPSDE